MEYQDAFEEVIKVTKESDKTEEKKVLVPEMAPQVVEPNPIVKATKEPASLGQKAANIFSMITTKVSFFFIT